MPPHLGQKKRQKRIRKGKKLWFSISLCISIIINELFYLPSFPCQANIWCLSFQFTIRLIALFERVVQKWINTILFFVTFNFILNHIFQPKTLFDIYVRLTGCLCGLTWPKLFFTSLFSYFNQIFVSPFSFFSFSQRISSIFCDIHFDILVLPAGGVFPLFLCSSAGMLLGVGWSSTVASSSYSSSTSQSSIHLILSPEMRRWWVMVDGGRWWWWWWGGHFK